jgi:hypothetical protein
MATMRSGVAAGLLGVVLWIPVAFAADGAANAPPPGAAADANGSLPGDDALTCDQIYAQATAESKRDQEDRAQRIEAMRAQNAATSALIGSAMLSGGLSGTAPAAQLAAEAQAKRQTGMLGAPPPNPRMDHLKQLWAQKHCVMK